MLAACGSVLWFQDEPRRPFLDLLHGAPTLAMADPSVILLFCGNCGADDLVIDDEVHGVRKTKCYVCLATGELRGVLLQTVPMTDGPKLKAIRDRARREAMTRART
jgi:hypothetical protein